MGQSNLVIGGIAANWGYRPQNLPFPTGTAAPAYKRYLGLNEVPAKWHLIPSNGFSRVHECDRRQTHGRTDHATVTYVAIGGTAFSDAAQSQTCSVQH